jgi:hypothetical protein
MVQTGATVGFVGLHAISLGCFPQGFPQFV